MTKEKRNKVFLCLGDKGKGKCIHSDIEIKDRMKPLWASSTLSERVKSLVIYCRKNQNFIVKLLVECPDYQNTRLDKFINEDSIKLSDEKCVQ